MSNLRKCDWCGKLFDPQNGEIVWGSYFLSAKHYCSNKCRHEAEAVEGAPSKKGHKGCLSIIVIAIIILVIGIVTNDKNEDEGKEISNTEKSTLPNVKIKRSDKNTKIKTEEEFNTFIETFTSNPNYQLSRIKFPLKYEGAFDDEGFLEKADWNYLGENLIFEGKKDVDYNECKGRFIRNKNKYTYELKRTNDSEIILRMFFQQIDGKWLLLKIEETM